MSGRPSIMVLAGVNGAGKSSVGGARLRANGLDWYNPDTYARKLMAETNCPQETANGAAWAYGKTKLEEAINSKQNHAFETMLGANTIPDLLKTAAASHRVMIWYCGLSSVELHLERVALRVACGGHDIPENKIRERWIKSKENLIGLIPFIHILQVYDNSQSASRGAMVPPPRLVLDYGEKSIKYPDIGSLASLKTVPEWAKPIVQAAILTSR